jgi:hypothetical protein
MSKDPKDPINEIVGQTVRGPRVPNYRPFGYNSYGNARGMDNGILPAISAGLNVASGISSMASRFMPRPNYPSQQPAPSVAPPAPRPAASSPAGGSNPYGFAASGSDQDTAANFFAADKRMQQAQVAPAPAPKSVAPPAPMRRPETKTPTDMSIGGETGSFNAAAAIPKKATPVDMPTAFDVNGWKGATNPVGGVKPSFAQADYDPMNKKPFEPTTSSDKIIPADLPAQGKPPTSLESESGPTKKDKKMSESTLINAFLKLQATEHSNIFEAAKKAKKDWDKDGKIESEKDEVWGSRFKAAKKAGKMEEEIEQVEEERMSKGRRDALARKTSFTADPPRRLEKPEPKETKSKKMKAYRADRDKHGEMEEEVGFSEAEIAHFEAVIARKDQKGKEKGIGDTVDSADLTDEYINEMAARGVKAGTKRGSYKGKAHKGGADATSSSMPAEEPKGVPHVLDQIRHGQEDEHGFKSITHPASSPDAPVTKRIHRSELHGFYDRYHNTEKPAGKEKEYSSFLGKHFGDERTSSPTTKSVTTDLSKVEKANLKGGGSKPTLGGSKLVGGSK